MKALSIKEPFGSLILDGKKTIETRKWKTKYRGPLLICTSLKPHSGDLIVDSDIINCLVYMIQNPEYKVVGRMLCVVDLVDCRPMVKEDEANAMCPLYDGYSWVLENIRPVEQKIIKGQLGLYNVRERSITYL